MRELAQRVVIFVQTQQAAIDQLPERLTHRNTQRSFHRRHRKRSTGEHTRGGQHASSRVVQTAHTPAVQPFQGVLRVFRVAQRVRRISLPIVGQLRR